MADRSRRDRLSPRWPAALAVLGGAVVLAVGAGWTTPAAADGGLTLTPARGSDSDPMQVTTSAGCPLPATNVLATMYGAGFGPAGVNVVGNTAAGVSATGRFTVPLVRTLSDLASSHQPRVTLHGTYTIVLTCRTPFNRASYASYLTSIRFTSPHAYVPTTQRAAVPKGPRASAPPAGSIPVTTAPAPATSPTTATAASPRTRPASMVRRFGVLRIVLASAGAVVLIGLAIGPRLWTRRRPPVVPAKKRGKAAGVASAKSPRTAVAKSRSAAAAKASRTAVAKSPRSTAAKSRSVPVAKAPRTAGRGR